MISLKTLHAVFDAVKQAGGGGFSFFFFCGVLCLWGFFFL